MTTTSRVFKASDHPCDSNASELFKTSLPAQQKLSAPTELATFVDVSAQDASDEIISLVSKDACMLLSRVIPNILTPSLSPQLQSSSQSVSLSETGEAYESKIVHFFVYIRYYTKLSNSELLYTYVLLRRLMEVEFKLLNAGRTTIVSEANLGTLLVCSAMITLKMTRDHPLRNSWWARVFNMPLSILNESEDVFLTKLEFQCNVSTEEYYQLYKHLTGSGPNFSQLDEAESEGDSHVSSSSSEPDKLDAARIATTTLTNIISKMMPSAAVPAPIYA